MTALFNRTQMEPILFHLFSLLLLATGCLGGILAFNHSMHGRLDALALFQERQRTICNVSLVISKNVIGMQVGFQGILLASSHSEVDAIAEHIAETLETVQRAAVFLGEGGVFVEAFKVDFDSMDRVVHTFHLDSGAPTPGAASTEMQTSARLIEGMLADYRNFAHGRLADESRGDSSSQLLLMHGRLSPFFAQLLAHANRFYVQGMKDLALNQQHRAELRLFHTRTLIFASCAAICVLILSGAMVVRSAWQVLTKRRQVEEALLADNRFREMAEKAEAANRAKSIFLANMSHEIRTPMNAIIGMTHLARQPGTDAERQRFLRSVQQSAESLLRLVNDILDFSKIEAGQLRLHAVPFVLRQLLEGIVSTMNVPAVEKGLVLQVRVQEELPAIFVGDDLRLRQILLNLVGNAIKFTRHGSVTISVSGGGSLSVGKELHFVVTDTGIGIPSEKCTVIFNSFEQAESSHARRFGGTGLGLAICSQLVGLMGGRIWVESTVGIGSAFHFTVVLQEGGDAAPTDPPAGEGSLVPDTGGLRVLVVDDNAVNRDIACMTLAQEHRITTAGNGLEALKLLAAEDFDVILMDVQMPEMDGLEATILIRSLEQGLPLPRSLPSGLAADLRQKLAAGHMRIIAMSAHAMGEEREVCLGAGMDGYITKPFHPAELARVLRSMATGAPPREKFFQPAADSPSVPVDVSTLSPRMAQVVTHLQTANNLTAEQLDHILAAARQSIANTLDKARDAAARADYPALASASHTLKGTLLQCGLFDLAQMVGEIHYDVKNHGGLSCDSILTQFSLILAQVFADEGRDHVGVPPAEDRL